MTETAEHRSRVMRAVKASNTQPEVLVRRLLHRMGYRYRLHLPDLPGKPDIVFPGRRKVIFVHGCFWHGHGCARGNRQPKHNAEYWQAKIARNEARDKKHINTLTEAGWNVLVLWECELKKEDFFIAKMSDFLGAPSVASRRNS